MSRALRALVVLAGAALAFLGLFLTGSPASASTPSVPVSASALSSDVSVTRAEAIRQLDVVRDSITKTLELIKAGKLTEALAEARAGYLDHFEYVEVPLRVADARFTSDAETKFAEIRGLISTKASTEEIRTNIIELRTIIDAGERKLTDIGIGAPAVVFGQSFIIIFREGLEAVLLISVLLGYLEAAKATQYRKPILMGMGAAGVATVGTFFLLRTVLAELPVGRELLEAITALVAVAVLFYVSFWLVARLEQKRWLEFLRARIWTAVSAGSTVALVLVGFTAVYREGFETALFYQSLQSFGAGLGGYILGGLLLGVVALVIAAWLIFKLGRKLPIKAFLSTAVILLMATSVAFLGNAVRALQSADVVGLHNWDDWPRVPIFFSQSLGYWPSRETLASQAALTLVYLAGALYVFVIRPRRQRAVVATSGTGGAPRAVEAEA